MPIAAEAKSTLTQLKDNLQTWNEFLRAGSHDEWTHGIAKLLAAVVLSDDAISAADVKSDGQFVYELAEALGISTNKELVRCLRSMVSVLAAHQAMSSKQSLSKCKELNAESQAPRFGALLHKVEEVLDNVIRDSLEQAEVDDIYEVRLFLY